MAVSRSRRRPFLGAMVAAVLWAGQSHAQGTDVRQPINDLYASLRGVMAMGTKATFQQRFDRLAPVIDRVFDLDTILRTSVGLRWQSLPDAARQTLSTVFRTFTIASYAANFDSDGGEKFEVLPQVRASGADQIVQSRLIASNGEPIRIDYLMRSSPASWRAVDVLLDGSISRVAVQRSDFRALLASGDATPLIDSLKRKVADLSGGTMRP
jgi:phospholipid transport system substrate-binding protein